MAKEQEKQTDSDNNLRVNCCGLFKDALPSVRGYSWKITQNSR